MGHVLLALLPIIWLIVALSVLKMASYLACLIALAITAADGIFMWGLPVPDTGSAALEGVLNGLWPICLVIIAALFTYNLTTRTRAMDYIKQMLGEVSNDYRVLLLIIAWGFGNFMEGMAGFGTAVAIPASMLVGIGCEPIVTIVACLVINTMPTVFGSVGVPAVTTSAITGINVMSISSQAALIQLVLTVISPFIAVVIIGKGVKALKGMIPITLVASLSFAVPQYFTACFIGAELPNIIGSIVSMVCIVLFAKLRKTKTDPQYRIVQKTEDGEELPEFHLDLKKALVSWSPFILIFVLLLCFSSIVPFIHEPTAKLATAVQVFTGKNPNTLTFSWLNTPGILIFIAGIIGGLIQGAGPGVQLRVLITTLTGNIKTIITICSVLALAKIMAYSGMITAIARFLVSTTGSKFPLISPLIGVVGGFMTGSGTSTSVLFGDLQKQTAEAIGLNPAWLCAANTMGAGIGKMISPQSIAIGCAATEMLGSESSIMKRAIKFCIVYTVIGGVICYLFPLLGIV